MLGLAWRLALLLVAAGLRRSPPSLAGPISARRGSSPALLVLGAAAVLWRHVQRTNMELAALHRRGQLRRFQPGLLAPRPGQRLRRAFGEALDEAIRRLRDERHKLIDANRFYEAVLDDAPTALLTVDADGKVELANKAARRLLVRHKGVRVDDFREYGDAFADALRGRRGRTGRGSCPLLSDGVPQTMLVSAAIVHRLGGLVRVVAVQPIQGELNAVEIAAQCDLIRVLTHEIMNSMTPVTSLAHSAVDLMREVDQGGNADVADARIAVETLARRADGVMHFVESYRQISRAPEVRAPADRRRRLGPRAGSPVPRQRPARRASTSRSAVDETLTLDADPGPDEPGADQPDPQRRAEAARGHARRRPQSG